MLDTITPGAPHYSEQSRYAKTIQKDGDVGGRRRGRQAGARQQHDDLLRLPLLVDPELLRLPPVDDGQSQDADAAQRRADHAQLDGLQLPGPARRRRSSSAWTAPSREPHRARPLGLRGPGQLAEPVALWIYYSSRPCRPRASAARRSARSCRTRSAPRRPSSAPTATSRPTGQQRLDGQPAAAGHQLHELHGPLRVGGRRQGRVRRRSRSPSATSRRRSSAATSRSWPIPTSTRRTRSAACSCRTRTTIRPARARRSSTCSSAASTSTPRSAKAGSASSTSATSTTRTSASGWSPRRSRRSASGST